MNAASETETAPRTEPDASASAAHRRRRIRRILSIASASLVFIILLMTYIVLRTPGWYKPPVVIPAQRQTVRNNLVAAEQAFTESLRSGRRFTYHLYAEDINRWISMRKEICPWIDELAPPMLAQPFVRFDDGLITVAGRYQTRTVDLILSLDIAPSHSGSAIVLRAEGLRCGSMPLPIATDAAGLDHSAEFDAGDMWPGSPGMNGDLIEGFAIAPEAWWKNGGVAYRVEQIEVRSGRLDITVAPLGLYSERCRNRHALP